MFEIFFVGNSGCVRLFLGSLRFQLTRFGGLGSHADPTASGLVTHLPRIVAIFYPPVRRAITTVERSYNVVSLSVTSVTNFVNLYLGEAELVLGYIRGALFLVRVQAGQPKKSRTSDLRLATKPTLSLTSESRTRFLLPTQLTASSARSAD